MWDRVTGAIGKGAFEDLRQKRVAVVGCGSGGGLVALLLAMAGVRYMTLVDPDRIEEGNLVRHIAGRKHLASKKVDAVENIVAWHIPDMQITSYAAQFSGIDNLLFDESIDMIVCGVDNEQAKFEINEFALRYKIPVVYAGVYEKGIGGDVFVQDPHDETQPCYACWSQNFRLGAIDADADGPKDYGQTDERGKYLPQPGLFIDVAHIATAQAKLALWTLIGEKHVASANTVLVANDVMLLYGTQLALPFETKWLNVERDPNCLVCGTGTAPDVDLAEVLEVDTQTDGGDE